MYFFSCTSLGWLVTDRRHAPDIAVQASAVLLLVLVVLAYSATPSEAASRPARQGWVGQARKGKVAAA